MKTQRDHLKEIMKLSEDHPNTEIIFMVDSDYMSDYSYTEQKIIKVEFDDYLCDDDRVCIGYDDIFDYYYNHYFTDTDLEGEELDKLINEKYEKEIDSKIIVYTN